MATEIEVFSEEDLTVEGLWRLGVVLTGVIYLLYFPVESANTNGAKLEVGAECCSLRL